MSAPSPSLPLPPRPKEHVPFLGEGPYAAASFPWQLAPPQNARVVVVKCTLSIVPGTAAVPLAEQDPPCGDVHHDDDPLASLRYASDFAPFKARADVTLVGHAHPRRPGVDRTTSVQLAFGRDLHRALAAVGDRRWVAERPSDPAPLAPVPLRLERAFGGPGDDANPYGVGRAGGRLPDLEQPDALLRGPGDRPAPACFAPLAATHPARAGKLGTYDQAWLKERWPYFPRDLDPRYFNAAPAAQQIPYPRGDEAFSLAGVHPELAVINGRLPGLSPRVIAVIPGRTEAIREIPTQLDTVWFDADALRVVLVWRGILDVSAEHAPEIAALFFSPGAIGAPLDAVAVEHRFAAQVTALHGPPPTPPSAAAETPPPPAPAVPAAEGAIAVPPAMTRDEAAARIASGASLLGADFSRCDLSDLDLRGRKLLGAIFTGARLHGACFDGADLSTAVLARATGVGVSFREADLRGASLAGARLVDGHFGGATLEDASLADADLERADLRGARLSRASFVDARLTGAAFDGATAASADFSGATLTGASMRGTVLDDAQMYGADAERVAFDGSSMARFRADEARLSESTWLAVKAPSASLESAILRGASFAGADLDGAVFCHADLERAVLSRATARRARFRHARLVRASALRANLMEASFESADLSQADLRGANLYGAETLKAKLDGAELDQAIVAGSKLATKG